MVVALEALANQVAPGSVAAPYAGVADSREVAPGKAAVTTPGVPDYL